jgi:hypothetical protein
MGVKAMDARNINENEILVEIEEIEEKIAPSSSTGFLD